MSKMTWRYFRSSTAQRHPFRAYEKHESHEMSHKLPSLFVTIPLFCLAIVIMQPAESIAGGSDGTEKPNIVLINVDDLGWTDLACQGSEYYQTPNIDRLAAAGLTFTNAYAAASNCAASRACMLTGQYGPRHGVYTVQSSTRGPARQRKLIPVENTLHIRANNLTIAGLLKAAGYRSISIGKWHVSENPIENGFDENVAGSDRGSPNKKTGGYHSPFRYPNCEQQEEGEYLTDRLTDEAIAFVKANQTEPFFLYLPFYTVHSPLQPKLDKKQKYAAMEGTVAHNNPSYAAMIESLDENVGRLLETLDELKLRNKTVVVFTSDNGGVWNTSRQNPLRAGKGSYFEGGIRVPLIVRWPGTTIANTKSDVPVSNIDFLPTFAEIATASIPDSKTLDGVSLVPLLKDSSAAPPERALFWHFPVYLQATGRKQNREFPEHDAFFRTRPGSAMRYQQWKLHEYFEDGRIELYDLSTDLGETKNIAADNPDVTSRLHQKLVQWRNELNAPVPQTLNPKYDPAEG